MRKSFRSIQFRSLQEKTWACFFELMGWAYVYEPTNLQVYGWLPDFKVNWPRVGTLFEIKRLDSMEDLRCETFKLDRCASRAKYRDVVLAIDPERMYRRDDEGRWFEWTIADADDPDRVACLWQEACNQTQWKPKDLNQLELELEEDDFKTA
jgi:hypothetical protein